MVRRWSYINNTNLTLWVKLNSKSILSGYSFTTFKQTTFFWEDLYSHNQTFLRRTSYFRRKRVNNFVVYQTVLAAWALDYNFFRKSLRSCLTLSLSKYNYVIHNLFLFSTLDISSFRGFEFFRITFIPRLVLNYNIRSTSKLFRFLLTFKGSLAIMSTSNPLTSVEPHKRLFKDIPYLPLLNRDFYTMTSKSIDRLGALTVLTQTLQYVHITSIGSVYKVFIYVALNNLPKKGSFVSKKNAYYFRCVKKYSYNNI